MKLKIARIIPNLRLHTVLDGSMIASRGYGIYKSEDNGENWEYVNTVPTPYYKRILAKNRLVSRLLRLGLSQIKRIPGDNFLVCCDKGMFLSDFSFSHFRRTDAPARFFQLLDNSLCVTPEYVYYGEYIPNPGRSEVNVFRSKDGAHWELAHSFPPKIIKHIHVLQYDKFSEKIWFSTGDAYAECLLGFADQDFSNLAIIGGNNQKWRTLEFLFTEDFVYWGMDSPIMQNKLFSYCRKDGEIKEIADFNGPIYNLRKIGNKGYIILTGSEGGKSEWDNKAHVWYSNNLHKWQDCLSFEKDALPHIFGFGRLLLAENTGEKIILSASALEGLRNGILFITEAESPHG
jgi:hypothetical protein